jgi:hypothetical protein
MAVVLPPPPPKIVNGNSYSATLRNLLIAVSDYFFSDGVITFIAYGALDRCGNTHQGTDGYRHGREAWQNTCLLLVGRHALIELGFFLYP